MTKIFEEVFSIKNRNNHKIITFLGIKMKFKIPAIEDISIKTLNIKNRKIGKYTVGAQKACELAFCDIEIGAFCSFADGVKLGVTMHPTDTVSTHHFFEHFVYGLTKDDMITNGRHKARNPKVTIGNDVWLGANVIVMPGVKIGDGVIVGSQSVVTKDLPDYAIAVGVPAKVIKYRFTEEEIKIIKNSKWWNWNDEILRERSKLFYSKDKFIEFCKKS